VKTQSLLVKKNFSKEIKRCCLKKYKTIPSNAQLSKDLFAATKYKLKINQETFRLWFKGQSFPDLDSLVYLIEWLGLNINNIFNLEEDLNILNEQTPPELDIESIKNLTDENIDLIVKILVSFKKI